MNPVPINHNKSSEDVKLEFECEIEEDVEAELEEFVRLNRTGRFTDAHQLYDECLSSHVSWYPIAAEYADCLLREGDLEQLAVFSQKAVTDFQDHQEGILFSLMQVIRDQPWGVMWPVMWPRLKFLWSALSFKPPFTSSKDTDVGHHEKPLMIK